MLIVVCSSLLVCLLLLVACFGRVGCWFVLVVG